MPLSKLEVLGRYAEIAMRCWTPAALARACSIKDKAYLTRPFILKYSLGLSPDLGQLHNGGLADDDLRSVGLLASSGHGDYAFYRDRIVITFLDGEQVVYLTSRRLSDIGPDGEPLPKNRKAMHLPSPPNGVERPDGYNLNVLNEIDLLRQTGLWLVEGPLDAAYCSDIGQPAVAFLGGKLRTNVKLIQRVRKRVSIGVQIYVALDGTPDVNERSRVLSAAAIHPDARICVLPEGRDPDTLSLEEIGDLKRSALSVETLYLQILERDLKSFAAGHRVWSHEFRDRILKQWRKQLHADPHRQRLLDGEVGRTLGMSADEYRDYLAGLEGKRVKEFVHVGTATNATAQQPASGSPAPQAQKTRVLRRRSGVQILVEFLRRQKPVYRIRSPREALVFKKRGQYAVSQLHSLPGALAALRRTPEYSRQLGEGGIKPTTEITLARSMFQMAAARLWQRLPYFDLNHDRNSHKRVIGAIVVLLQRPRSLATTH